MWALKMQLEDKRATAEAVYELIRQRINPLKNGGALAKTPEVESKIIAKIETMMLQELPIHMVIPAFPAKSANREKTLGHLPDMGEVLALKNLNGLCDEISALYAAGAEITICSDGRVFNDLVLVSDTAVSAYQASLHQIIKKFGLNSLNTFNLDDVLTDFNFFEMREELMRKYALSQEELRAKIQTSPQEAQLFNGIHRFIFEDRVVLAPAKSREKTRNESKAVAYEVVRRSQAWSALVEEKFPHSLRLSIHPQSESSEKIGVRLLPSENHWRTPWHSVVLIKGDSPSLVSRKEAIEQGAKLKFMDDTYGFYDV